MSKFDAWLERPYIEAAQKAEDYEKFCEEHNLDSGNPESEIHYEAWLDLQVMTFDVDVDPKFTEEGDN